MQTIPNTTEKYPLFEVNINGVTANMSRHWSQISLSINKSSNCTVYQYRIDGSKFIRPDLCKRTDHKNLPTIGELVDTFIKDKEEDQSGKLRGRAEKRAARKRDGAGRNKH